MNWWLELKSLRQRWYGRTIHIPYLHDISERAWLICVTNRMNVISVASRVMDAAPSGSYERGRGWRSLLICRSVFFFFFFVFFFTRWANRNRPTVWSRWRRRTWWSCRCWRPAARTPWPTRSKSSPNSCGRWCTSKRSTTVGCSTRDRSCPHTAPPPPHTIFFAFSTFFFLFLVFVCPQTELVAVSRAMVHYNTKWKKGSNSNRSSQSLSSLIASFDSFLCAVHIHNKKENERIDLIGPLEPGTRTDQSTKTRIVS